MYEIDIFNQSVCSPVFLETNSHLINKHSEKFEKLTSNEEKFQLLEQLWFEDYEIKLSPSRPMIWQKLIFKNDRDKTMFLLKSNRQLH